MRRSNGDGRDFVEDEGCVEHEEVLWEFEEVKDEVEDEACFHFLL